MYLRRPVKDRALNRLRWQVVEEGFIRLNRTLRGQLAGDGLRRLSAERLFRPLRDTLQSGIQQALTRELNM